MNFEESINNLIIEQNSYMSLNSNNQYQNIEQGNIYSGNTYSGNIEQDSSDILNSTYLDTLVDIQRSINELNNRDLDELNYNYIDNVNRLQQELLNNIQEISNLLEPSFNSSFGSYQNISNINTHTQNINDMITNYNSRYHQSNGNIHNNANIHNNNRYDEFYSSIMRPRLTLENKNYFNKYYNKNKVECNICFNKKKYFTEIKQCKHQFCNMCLRTWIEEHNTCPMCRTQIQ